MKQFYWISGSFYALHFANLAMLHQKQTFSYFSIMTIVSSGTIVIQVVSFTLNDSFWVEEKKIDAHSSFDKLKITIIN